MVREHIYEGSQFIDLIDTARSCRKESLGNTTLNYPEHSLVIYSELRNGNDSTVWEKTLEKRDPHFLYEKPDVDDADFYHYQCPKQWLAMTKTDVELIVVVSNGDNKKIGYYNGNVERPAFTSTYDLKFFDLKSETVVAKGAVKKSDHDIVEPSFYHVEMSYDLPSADEVVQQIREHVRFLPGASNQ